ncbi:MAG: hypothetical protein ACYSW8_23120 [Planctomycetota bacterium]
MTERWVLCRHSCPSVLGCSFRKSAQAPKRYHGSRLLGRILPWKTQRNRRGERPSKGLLPKGFLSALLTLLQGSNGFRDYRRY